MQKFKKIDEQESSSSKHHVYDNVHFEVIYFLCPDSMYM